MSKLAFVDKLTVSKKGYIIAVTGCLSEGMGSGFYLSALEGKTSLRERAEQDCRCGHNRTDGVKANFLTNY